MIYKHITKQQAYYLGVVMWGYLYQFLELDYKWKLPKKTICPDKGSVFSLPLLRGILQQENKIMS